MTRTTTITIPAAWLNPLPSDFKIPTWKWILLPTSAWMLSRNRGYWVGGEFSLRADDVHFVQKGVLKSPRAAEWTLTLSAIDDVAFKKGFASDLIAVHHGGQVTKIMSVRSDEFFTALKAAVALSRIALPD
ncbi:hypothetical protein J2857_004939 [Neorhizobium galegae]|uniref:hypothetical protein n=1 Tax=Neorhizobium galegae TaxID=399 RepID=UPI001AE98F91|nr:hypothetical protein [Neorhizobium galegae]MBP2562148.1 hypothetical protein [Neorhizobium galegae]